MDRFIWNDLTPAQQDIVLSRPAVDDGSAIEASAQSIIENVRQRGDEAVLDYTQKFDGVPLKRLRLYEEEIKQAVYQISKEAKQAIDTAYANIEKFHLSQGFKEFDVEVQDGIKCQRKSIPLNVVGLYIPGGTAPLVSTTLMCSVPAKIAGVKETVLCTPCDREGNINPHILYAASLCGITQIFKIGGAQAIAAMAFGTDSVTKVDKIYGPGNAYVTHAKRLVGQDPIGAAYDLPAGPSEVLVIADETTNPKFAAADLLSQAEHDMLSQVVLLTPSKKQADKIVKEVERQIKKLPREEIARSAISNSRVIITDDLTQAIQISNKYAPEHLILSFDTAEDYVDQITCAGSVFVGHYACESAGDYCSGSNHVLPTYGYARQYSGLSVEAFQKTITFQRISQKGLNGIADTIETLARLEGLEAHARAVSIRR